MMTETRANEILPGSRRVGPMWDAGAHAYDGISRQIADAIEHAVDRLDPQPGERILDAATGTGWTARRVAARGAQVTGIDIGPGLIDAAADLDTSGDIDFRVADVEALPFPDGYFDGVVSTFGVMFANDPERAAAELGRAVRLGGRLSLATWPPEGSVREMFDIIARHRPTPNASKHTPFAWGDTGRLVELFGERFDLGFEQAVSYYRAESGAAAWESFSTGFGPVVTLLEELDVDEAVRFRSELEIFFERWRTGAGILVPREYVITLGHRRI